MKTIEEAREIAKQVYDASPKIDDGSEKQVKWADQLRFTAITYAALKIGDTMSLHHDSEEFTLTLDHVKEIANVTSAKWWINVGRWHTEATWNLLSNIRAA